MTLMNDSIRLEPLHDIARCASIDDARGVLLSLCISKGIRVYFAVPPGHVVANHEMALVDRRANFPGARPVVKYFGRALIEHQIKWIMIDFLGLKQMLDAGSVVLEQHFEGGLVGRGHGLSFRRLECCVIRRDSPTFLPSDFEPKPVRLTEGAVFPIKQEVQFRDLFVSRDDAGDLRKAVQPSEIADKWGHKVSAPHIYRLYSISQEALEQEEVERRLIEGDESGVFTLAIAETVARILKVGVRGHAEKGLNVAAIRDNPLEKDYSDPTLSNRMSLVLLATDCWLHDQAVGEESEKDLESKRIAVELAREKKAGSAELKRLEMDLAEATLVARGKLSSMQYMPSGLRKYLEELGFRSNQAQQLERIIVGKKVGGVHVGTTKCVASTTTARKME